MPTTEIVSNPIMLYIAIGILGATVMPHNLYLHSSIVQTRKVLPDDESKREAIRFATLDSTVALLFAFFINASILILAAATFHNTGHQEVADIGDAYHLLTPLLGTTLASTLFAVALLASGQNSTITGTLAGQIVMEGFLNIRLPAWLRRLITRLIAIVPAVIVTAMYGERGAGGLLILSQVILSLQLSFAVIPLVYFTSQRRKMGAVREQPSVGRHGLDGRCDDRRTERMATGGDLQDVAGLEPGGRMARKKEEMLDRSLTRRDLLRAGALGTVGLAAGGSVLALPGLGQSEAGPVQDHASHHDMMTVGKLAPGSFDPSAFLTHFDTGKVSRLPSGQVLREYRAGGRGP